MAVAPTAARFAAAEGLAVPSRWTSKGADHRAVWGRCRGSGREPYDTMVDHAQIAWRCSCPSRLQPCKHALALLAMWARGQVPADIAPAAISAWGDANARRPAAAAAGTAPTGPPNGPSPSGVGRGRPAGADAATYPDGAADGSALDLERGRNERVARLHDGLVELDRWIDDRIRTGLADPALARYDTWDGLAARLVDARAGSLANRVRRLAGVVGARPDWHEVVLAELGILHLLAQAGQRVPDLPAPLADVVATAVGWQVRQADVLAGVPDTDAWIVAGRSDTREDRIEVRRVWLRGQASGRWAMVLSFAAYRQALDTSLQVGAALEADLHRYPGRSQRALVGTVHDPSPLSPPGRAPWTPPAGTVADACDEVGRTLGREPWTDRVPATLRATPTAQTGRWMLTDETGSLMLARGVPGLATLLAASAGLPVVVTVEWTIDGAVPLTVHLDDRTLDIGPVADATFVTAA